jgi:hypothetical protein
MTRFSYSSSHPIILSLIFPLPDHFIVFYPEQMDREETSNVSCESVQNVEGRDTRFLRKTTFKLLQHVEKAAELCNNPAATDAELEKLDKTTKLLFGGKKSLADVMVMLSDLMLKLNQKMSEMDGSNADEFNSHFTDFDVQLAKNFLKDLRA